MQATQETRVWSLEDPLEKEMATHSSILAWRIPWTEEPGGLQSMGLQSTGLQSIWLKRLSTGELAPLGGAVVLVVDCIQQLLPLSQGSTEHLLKTCWLPGSMKSTRGGVVSNTRRIFFKYFFKFYLASLGLSCSISESHSVTSESSTPWTIQSMEFSWPEYWSG